jgi:membrane protein required for colicin V production
MAVSQAFNWIDVTITGVIVVSILISLIRGFIREALSLIIWGLALYVSLKFAHPFSTLFSGHINNDSIRVGVSFVCLFVLTLMGGALLSYVLSLLVEKTGLSGSDRLMGMIFGFLRGVLVVAVLLLIAKKLTSLPHDPLWRQSHLVPKFAPIEHWLEEIMHRRVKQYLPVEKIKSNSSDVNQDLLKAFLPKAKKDATPTPAPLDVNQP